MSEYLSSDEEKEKLIEWWKEYGRFIVTGVSLGLIGIFAWNSWIKYQDKQAGEAAVIYSELATAYNSDDAGKATELLEKIATNYKSTSYAAQAYLLKASNDVQSKDLTAGIKSIEMALGLSNDSELNQLANLRLAKLHFANKDYAASLATLNKVKSTAYGPLKAELEGDVHYAQGEFDKAKASYEAAQAAMQETPVGDPNLIQMKLSDLGAAQSLAQ